MQEHSGQEPQLPTGWRIKSLPEELAFISGKAHEQHISEFGSYVVVNSKFISSDGKVRKFATENFQPAKTGDILMVMSDLPNGKALAKTFLVDRDDLYAVNQRVCILRTKAGYPEYFRYQLNRAKYFLSFDDGVQQTHLLNRVFEECPIVVPESLDEQRAIADALSDIDDLIASLDALIAKKRDIKQATMQQLLTGKTRLPGFSGNWREVAFGAVVHIRNEKRQTNGLKQSQFCVELENMEQGTGRLEGFSDASSRTSTKYLFNAGDVLFGRLRPYLQKYWLADRGGVCSTEVWPLIPIDGKIDPSFLYQIVQSREFIDAASTAYGTHMPRADWSVISKFSLRMPENPDEQATIGSVFRSMERDLATLADKQGKLFAIKEGMMQQLLTGRTRLV